MWVPGIEFRLSGLAANTPPGTIPQALVIYAFFEVEIHGFGFGLGFVLCKTTKIASILNNFI